MYACMHNTDMYCDVIDHSYTDVHTRTYTVSMRAARVSSCDIMSEPGKHSVHTCTWYCSSTKNGICSSSIVQSRVH